MFNEHIRTEGNVAVIFTSEECNPLCTRILRAPRKHEGCLTETSRWLLLHAWRNSKFDGRWTVACKLSRHEMTN